jgi:cytochrome c biogenesis protein CcmG/thiol:disulfide interchange protein DsbE
MIKVIIPLVLFVILVVFLAIGLGRDPHKLPSALINKPAPEFALAELRDPTKIISLQQMRGKVWILNVWGSWCPACREEHPFLMEIARSGTVPIYGLSWKDKREDALAVLSELGDPYILNMSDFDGRVAIDYGITGAPESYLIDKNGVIRYKEPGQLTPEIMRNKILPLVQELNR